MKSLNSGFKKIFKKALPSQTVNYLKKKKQEKVFEKNKTLRDRTIIKTCDVEDILNKIDFNSDFIIHSSTSNIGKFEDGWKKIAELILSKVDFENYTILAPAFPFITFMEDYIKELNDFDIKSAPNMMGNISKFIMNQSGCLRSLHPSHSTLALGKKAELFTNEHHLSQSSFDEKSPFYKLIKNNGKILMFGVGLNNVTNSRVYEDILKENFPLKIYLGKEFSIKCINIDGELYNVKTKCHSKKFSSIRDNEIAREYLVKNDCIKTYKIGNSEISVIDARKHTITLLEMLLEGITVYGKVNISENLKAKIQKEIDFLKS